METRKLILNALFCMLFLITGEVVAADITSLGVTPSAEKDNTLAIQTVLNSDVAIINFPAGVYKTGTIKVPSDKKIYFDPKAKLIPIPDKIIDKNLFVVVGDNVRFEGLVYDFAWNGATITETPVHNLIYADKVNNLFVTQCDVMNSDPRGIVPLADRKRRGRLMNLNGTDPAVKYNHQGYYNSQCIIYVKNSSHITLENSKGTRLHGMIDAYTCSNVTSRGNHMISGNYMTHLSEGGECLRHHDNWSRDVKYQVCWFGGSPDPSRKPALPRGSSTVAIRQIKPDSVGYNKHTSGVYDVLIQNNYAEYGNTLAWGNKGRQVVIDGNIARFISDYAYGTEGGENIIFSNNISINSTAGGIVSMYWGEKLQVTGNMIIIRHEPWEPEWSWWDHPSKYLGTFVRLHHGPADKDDMYGAGTTFISDNLFISELTQRTTDLSIHHGRDVTISGNKFINGKINKFGDGKLSVLNNEFISRLDFDPSTISVVRGAEMAIVKGNVFRKEKNINKTTEKEQQSELNDVPYFLFTENENTEESGSNTDAPAISLSSAIKFFGLVEDNFIYGWKESVKGDFGRNKNASLIVRNNTTDGKVQVDGGESAKMKVEKNMSLERGLMPE